MRNIACNEMATSKPRRTVLTLEKKRNQEREVSTSRDVAEILNCQSQLLKTFGKIEKTSCSVQRTRLSPSGDVVSRNQIPLRSVILPGKMGSGEQPLMSLCNE